MDASLSPSVDDHDFDDDEPQAGGKPGRKKGPANQAARRDQNRIAQREFRLRKQQRIRDLEARVEILSGTKEETHTHTRAIIQGLMEENSRLRTLVRDLSGFMGEGLGGPLLDKTGWTMQQFKDFVSRADSDTAYESFVQAKAAARTGGATPSSSLSGPADLPDNGDAGRKRKRDSLNADSADPPSGPPSSTRRTYSSGRGGGQRAQSPSELPSLLPTGQPFRVNSRDVGAPSSFSSLVDTLNSSASAPFVELTGPSHATPRGSIPTPTSAGYSPQGGFTMAYNSNGAAESPAPSAAEIEARRAQLFAENEPKRNEAGKLIKYHLDNYRRNENYFLPASLRPTLVQRTVSHDPLVDGIIYPEVRDRMILLKDQYDLAQCLTEFLWTVIIHGDDVLAHTNWELGEQWLRTYGFLVEGSVLASCNKWRRARGDVELTMQDIHPDNQGDN